MERRLLNIVIADERHRDWEQRFVQQSSFTKQEPLPGLVQLPVREEFLGVGEGVVNTKGAGELFAGSQLAGGSK